LLGDIASKSLGGVYNYVPDSNDPVQLTTVFSRTLACLITIVAQDLELTVTPFPSEATINKVDAGTYPADPVGDGSSPVTVRFGTLSSEEARSAAVELALSDRAGSRPYHATVANVLYRFTAAQGQPVTAQPEPIAIRRGAWEKVGRHYTIAAKSSHHRRRTTDKGDDDAGPYDTKRVKEYRRQVEMAGERPPPSAADDEIELEEMESAMAVKRTTRLKRWSRQWQSAVPKPGPARLVHPVRLTKHHNSDAPLGANDQKVLLELHGVSSDSRAPLDLVAVIDVSSSMMGARLDNAKKALIFLVRKLTDCDRLCIVKFDDEAAQLCQLRHVTEAARDELEVRIAGLNTCGHDTNIEAGLRTGVAVLAERKFTAGRAANIMLLSHGKEIIGNARRVDPGNVPVHTFGLGPHNNSRLLGTVASKSLGGVYNFVPDSNDPARLSKAFSRILAGLLTIVAQDLELTVAPFPEEATIKKVDAGTYPVLYNAAAGDNSSSSVTVRFGALSSEETRSVVIELALTDRTGTLPYRATVTEAMYRFSTSRGQLVTSDPEPITIRRGRKVSDMPVMPRPVETEEIRQLQADTIKEAIVKADDDKMEEAWNILAEALKKLVEARKRLLDPILDELQKELMKLLTLFKTTDLYRELGRPYAIAAAASHGRRRSAEKGDEVAGPYYTQRIAEYHEQARLAGERPPPSAADDEPEKQERAAPQRGGRCRWRSACWPS
ncbi:hypothetical protein EJB05_27923, partial [Eragrostis curvula]